MRHVRQGIRSQDEGAPETDELLDRAVARWMAALGRAGADAGVAFTSDELIGRLERAKRNRETVLGSARGAARPASEG
jgi:hypothetical protein